MRATIEFLNRVVLVHQPTKLTREDRAAVRKHLDKVWTRTPTAERDAVLRAAASLLAHYDWPRHIVALVARLIAYGVTADDYLLQRAWMDRDLKRNPVLDDAIREYRL